MAHAPVTGTDHRRCSDCTFYDKAIKCQSGAGYLAGDEWLGYCQAVFDDFVAQRKITGLSGAVSSSCYDY
ncbi:hypothetical protein Ct61P_09904 [Colletotrichum tofieldiae]|nr:hypothetical protein Ct61P_09904 [Colletotrichum tofieldiae]